MSSYVTSASYYETLLQNTDRVVTSFLLATNRDCAFFSGGDISSPGWERWGLVAKSSTRAPIVSVSAGRCSRGLLHEQTHVRIASVEMKKKKRRRFKEPILTSESTEDATKTGLVVPIGVNQRGA